MTTGAMPATRASRPSFHETAEQHLVARVPTAAPDDRAGDVRRRLAETPFATIDAVYVLDRQRRLVGRVPTTELLPAPADQPLQALAATVPAVQLDTDQEHVAQLAAEHALESVPVVDRAGAFAGVVPGRALLRIVQREHAEDIHRLAGILRETAHARWALQAPPARRARDRLPWLVVGLGGSVMSVFVVAGFVQVLEQRLAVAFFVPAIVYLADAIGTQTEAVVVRALASRHAIGPRVIAGEFAAGALLGAMLAGVALPVVWLAFGDGRLALAVALAILVAGGLATTIGAFLPWTLARWRLDPAFGSGPLATIIQDVLSLLVYFAIVEALVC
jgi:magnesium transporter